MIGRPRTTRRTIVRSMLSRPEPAPLALTESQYSAACDRIARGEPMEMDAALRDIYERGGGTVSVWDAGTKRWWNSSAASGIRGWVD